MSDAFNTLRVSLFAGMAELVGTRIIEIPWAGGTVHEVRNAIIASHPGLESLLARSAVAIGDRYATADEPVSQGADVAIIPPVSGG
jgi:molybdopterin converting factor small subunit